MSDYLVWSNEHGRWWGPGHCGYVARIADAGRYTERQALEICAEAVPGRRDSEPLPEIPVLLSNLEIMLKYFAIRYPGHDPEPPC